MARKADIKGLGEKPKQNGLTLEDYAQSVVVDEVYSQIKRIDLMSFLQRKR